MPPATQYNKTWYHGVIHLEIEITHLDKQAVGHVSKKCNSTLRHPIFKTSAISKILFVAKTDSEI